MSKWMIMVMAGWISASATVGAGLPAELIQLISGPARPQAEPVPIGSNGHATTIHLAAARPVRPMTYTNTTFVDFGQFIPRPFCSTGPADWLHITGGVEFFTSVKVNHAGRFSYRGGYRGTIYATPVDINNDGQPIGEMFEADVRGRQHGAINEFMADVHATDRKLSHETGGAQIENIGLRVTERGRNRYRAFYKCLDAD